MAAISTMPQKVSRPMLCSKGRAMPIGISALCARISVRRTPKRDSTAPDGMPTATIHDQLDGEDDRSPVALPVVCSTNQGMAKVANCALVAPISVIQPSQRNWREFACVTV